MGRFILALVIMLGFALPAVATPSRSASSSDQLLAANATHFYVLRDLVDNRGSYFAEFRDQYLVEIRFADHKATNQWLLRRLTLRFEETTDPFTNWQEAEVPAVDLIALLQKNNAIPIRAMNQSYQLDLFKMTFEALEPQGIDAPTLSTGEIGVLARRQLNPLAARYGPDPDSENWMGSQIAVEPVDFNPNPDCTVVDEIAPFLNGAQMLAGVKLECWFDSDVYRLAAFYLFLPVTGY
ncbi:MAG: hypothetical protein GXP03_12240 [Alphaproteobacteria bacterium]|nr:hypothetical protein [Alphaproteobacteria bacterium]